jgi:hypothetical protein
MLGGGHHVALTQIDEAGEAGRFEVGANSALSWWSASSLSAMKAWSRGSMPFHGPVRSWKK